MLRYSTSVVHTATSSSLVSTCHHLLLRCTGIPNTKHFHDITSIEDALHLYSKIQASIHSVQFTTDADEEFEDTEGNILNRRTYEDLARQGLL